VDRNGCFSFPEHESHEPLARRSQLHEWESPAATLEMSRRTFSSTKSTAEMAETLPQKAALIRVIGYAELKVRAIRVR
jgi:hypothetical protein